MRAIPAEPSFGPRPDQNEIAVRSEQAIPDVDISSSHRKRPGRFGSILLATSAP